MFGGEAAGIARNEAFFNAKGISPQGSRLAVDLGAGSGFQSIPLAKSGFSVLAIDLSEKLLKELKANAGPLPIKTALDDLMNFEAHLEGTRPELIVCMTDTILNLDSKEKVCELFAKAAKTLMPGGKLAISFRDCSAELSDLDRFIPVRSDDNVIFTCFLEYEPKTVKVHDLVYRKAANGSWSLNKSFYRKLRLSKAWVDEKLKQAGFKSFDESVEHGMISIIASK